MTRELLERVFPNTPVTPITRVSIDSFGGPGTWKSGLVGSMPEPIIVINLDPRPFNHIRSLYPDKYISVHDVGVIGDMDEFSATTAYNQVKQLIDLALQLDEGTLAFDGSTQLWTLIKLVILAPKRRERAARDKDLSPFDYDLANAEWQNTLGHLNRAKFNTIFTHQESEVWDTDERGKKPGPTGRFKPKESSVMPYGAEVQLYHHLAPSTDESLAGQMVPWAMVTHCKLREGIVGMKFEKPTFDKLRPWIVP